MLDKLTWGRVLWVTVGVLCFPMVFAVLCSVELLHSLRNSR